MKKPIEKRLNIALYAREWEILQQYMKEHDVDQTQAIRNLLRDEGERHGLKENGRLRDLLSTRFIYSEYGAGARLLVPNPDGEPWLFADFESHTEAEVFLELIDWVKKWL